MFRNHLLAACAGLAFAAAASTPALAADAGKPELGSFGFDATGMDRGVAPGADWVRFANGKYNAAIEIPADRTSFGMFTALRDLSQTRTRGIVEQSAREAATAPRGSDVQKVGDFYASFVDEAGIEARGTAPIRPRLDAIAAIASPAALAAAFGDAGRYRIDVPIGVGVLQDLKDPSIMSAYVGQGGLGLPDRDYYLDTKNPRFAEVRARYVPFIAQMLTLAGVADAGAKAQMVYDLEVKIATAHWSQVEQRQVDKLYNPVDRDAIAAAYPGVDWTALLTAAGVDKQPRLIIANPSAITAAARLMTSEPLESWKAYLAFHTLRRAAPLLPKAFVDASFAFTGTVLNGQPANQERWKRGVDATSEALGEAAGKLYVAQYFPPEAKAKADALVKNLIVAMDSHLAALEWMDPATKTAARAKLAAFTPKIGYPDKWRDYSALDVVRSDALGNSFRAAAFDYQRELDKIGKPIDRSEWGMTPMTVNAYANPLWNEIVFPAAILQAPFFDPAADPAVNYGGIGMVIGHEISHHFDDQGRKFDKDGKLADWWTAEDVKRFTALTDRVVKQYAAYTPLPGVPVNGELTLGENIADLAGITIAHDAWQRSLGGKPAPVLEGFSGEQRFFLGAAQVWRQKFRDAYLQRVLTTDPHTPGHYRPYVVRNIDAWYGAFAVKPADANYLAPTERVKIW